MIWATRNFSSDGWYWIQDRFEEQYEAAGDPADMMLLILDRADRRTDLYVGVPDVKHLASYEGFRPIDEREIPKHVGLLFGSQREFDRHFRTR